MRSTGTSMSLQEIGRFGSTVNDIINTGIDFGKTINHMQKANYMFALASSMETQSTLIPIDQLLKEDGIPLINMSLQTIKDDPSITISKLYDRYMEDEGLLAMYENVDKETIVSTSLSLLAGLITGGPIGLAKYGLADFGMALISFNVDAYMNFFNYTAWLALRYGFSGRFSERLWEYLMS